MPLPPLNALRAFEAAARHNGFVAAADELCITRGAVSRHVKLLEAHLGVTLFRRTHRGVDLTAAGQRLLPVLTDAFSAIERETRSLTAQGAELRIICPPALSIRWLFPRLESFRRDHPEIRVRLTTEFYGQQGFDAAEYDLGISLEHRPGRSPDIEVQPLFPMVLSPACAPDLAEGGARLTDPHQVGAFTLLHESPRRSDWATWLETFGIGGVDVESGEVFPNLDMAVRAAVMGSGVVMADLFLCREELARGTLVLPFPDMRCETPEGRYCLIGPRDKWKDRKVRAFRDWVAGMSGMDTDAAR
ncbi:transcriptional regulator, LysR family [Cribrihabitans marinus]|uniref:Transcriptional regulator, LysR family n=1 Tax=Cribrihabitans marinus TaxID=1227549 RepID=A0A1H7AYL4_9RHOB|nr:LysR substrate-binding domain-containing protein [Cribrihabitans marinus]GGH32144.1 LysR family transcriptional regulator [Cribrihabitans marinus]SEJ66960.1 transcriptional regulator, LysR family [Cribrihabitans marinus]